MRSRRAAQVGINGLRKSNAQISNIAREHAKIGYQPFLRWSIERVAYVELRETGCVYRPREPATVQASSRMTLMLGDDRSDLWQLCHLMPPRWRILRPCFTRQTSVTILTYLWHMMHIAIHPLGRQTLARMPLMSGLSARFASCGLTWRRLMPRRVGTGRLMGIGRVLIEFGF